MSDLTTLWEMLSKGKITVPQIQRDYAQGRKGKEYIRRTFLREIKKSLENNEKLTLDFVYGNTENEAFCPLDGQQRLTTLWLLHWYFSFKSGSLGSDQKELIKFSYQTRTSSGEFCAALCDKMDFADYNKCQMPVAEYIKSQTWFYSSWLQDPTISSMLRTISGDGENTDDNIEGVFNEVVFKTYKERLQNNIQFFRLNIGTEKLPISDDLYIKMNARGKGLTNFENFKADLLAWFRSDENPENNKDSQKNEVNALRFAKIIDTDWTNVFWESAKANLGENFKGHIDEIFFSFFNRFVVNMICLKEGISPADFAPKGTENDGKKETLKEVSFFNKLYGVGLGKKRGADDSKVSYEGFEAYKDYLTFENVTKIDEVLKKVSNTQIQSNINAALSGIVDDDEDETKTQKCFIPQYSKEDFMLNQTTQKERIYFHAVFIFLVTPQEFNQQNFNRWMRVVKNITENAAVDNVPNMINCLRKINNIGERASQEYNWDIYKCLSEYTIGDLSSQLDYQLQEEKEKAQKLCQNSELEERIEQAEKYAFFNGTIRFLYKDEIGKINWENFENKFKNAKELFNGKSVEPNTIKVFLSLFNNFDEIKDLYLFTTIGYHPRNKNWKRDILCSNHEVIRRKVHDFLIGKTSNSSETEPDYREFLQSKIIDTILNKGEDFKYRCRKWNDGFAIHKMYSQSEGVYVSGSLFKSLKNYNTKGDIKIINESIGNNYYWGTRIVFDWQNESYSWYGGNSVYKIVSEKEEVLYSTQENIEDILVLLKDKGDLKNG